MFLKPEMHFEGALMRWMFVLLGGAEGEPQSVYYCGEVWPHVYAYSILRHSARLFGSPFTRTSLPQRSYPGSKRGKWTRTFLLMSH